MSGPVVVYEPNFDGHRLSYVRHLVEYCVAGARPVAVLTSPAGLHEHGSTLEGLGARARAVSGLDEALEAAHRIGGHLVVPDGDRAALTAALRVPRPSRRCRQTYLVMRPRRQAGTHPAVYRLKSALLGLARRRGVRVVTLLPATGVPTSGDQVRDPVEIHHRSADLARAVVGGKTSAASPLVGIVGALDARKNCAAVARAVLDTRAGMLILAGRQDEQTRSELRPLADEPRVLQVDRRLGDDELDSFVALCDAVVIAHTNDGASGIYGRALALGTPVVVVGRDGAIAEDLAAHPAHGLLADGLGTELTRALEGVVELRPPSIPVGTPEEFAGRLVGC